MRLHNIIALIYLIGAVLVSVLTATMMSLIAEDIIMALKYKLQVSPTYHATVSYGVLTLAIILVIVAVFSAYLHAQLIAKRIAYMKRCKAKHDQVAAYIKEHSN